MSFFIANIFCRLFDRKTMLFPTIINLLPRVSRRTCRISKQRTNRADEKFHHISASYIQ